MRGFVPHTEDEIRSMLAVIGVKDIEELFTTVPDACRFPGDLDLAPGLDEHSTAQAIEELAAENWPLSGGPSFLGGGVYDRIIPSVGAQILSRPEFYSAYTPYQPEVSQGTLQVIFEFQTLIARLTGMDVANASMYDGASALAEAVLLAAAAKKRNRFLLPASLQPSCRRVVETYASGMGNVIDTLPWTESGEIDAEALSAILAEDGADVATVVVQNPNYFGVVEDIARIAPIVKAAGAMLIVHVEASSLALIEAPGELGADIVTGEGQSLGLPMNFGGPYLGLMAVSQAHVRRLPGRLVGATEDANGKVGYVLTLQTREQHIRREKATSNICTNQGLMALAATVYLCSLGEQGMADLANGLASRAAYLAKKIAALPGYSLPFSGDFYQEFVVKAPGSAARVLDACLKDGMHGGLDLSGDYPELGDGCFLVTVSEKHSTDDLDNFANFLGSIHP